MTARQKVRALAAELGATVEQEGGEIAVTAPDGMQWACGVIELVASRWEREPMEILWQDVLDRMREGVKPESPEQAGVA